MAQLLSPVEQEREKESEEALGQNEEPVVSAAEIFLSIEVNCLTTVFMLMFQEMSPLIDGKFL